MNTLLLDTVTWDLCVDSNRNIAMATEPYSLAQDVASASRLFIGELWYDNTQGVPYWASILGKMPPASYLKAKYIQAAMTVPDIVTAQMYVSSFGQEAAELSRLLTGQIQITGPGGQTILAPLVNAILGEAG